MLELLKKYRTPLLAGTLILAALLIYSANLRHQERTTLFEKVILQVTAPLQKGVDTAWEIVSGWWNHYVWLVNTEQERERLQEENRQLRAEVAGLTEIRLANERLRRLLTFRQEIELPVLPAQVIAEDAASWFRTAVIDKGTSAGLREGLPVVVAEGIVGRTISCSAQQCRILMITDASSGVASLVQRNRTRGVIRGQGEVLSLEFAARQADIQVGDWIITSGTGGIFPKGLRLGEVTKVIPEKYGLFQKVEVVPAVDFARLEEVLVLLKDG